MASRPIGTQTVDRALRLLRLLATRGQHGWRLVDVAKQCDLDQSTAHRLLTFLVRERLAQRRQADRHYFPGPLLFELGLALPHLSRFVADCERPLGALSRKFGATSYLYFRSGMDFVCAARSGSVYDGLLVEAGSRFPLVYSAGGVAITIALPADELKAVVTDNLGRLQAAKDVRLQGVKRMLRRSKVHGCGVNYGDTTRGIHAFGVAITDAKGRVFGSVALAGSSERLPASMAPSIIEAVTRTARGLSEAALRIGHV